MPRKPKRPCRYQGCPKMTDGIYCAEHERIMNRHYEHFARGYDSHERYGKTWQKVRDRYIAVHPLCEMCEENGRYVKAVLVHHIKPISDGGTNEEDNLISLCFSCHEKIHRRGRTHRRD